MIGARPLHLHLPVPEACGSLMANYTTAYRRLPHHQDPLIRKAYPELLLHRSSPPRPLLMPLIPDPNAIHALCTSMIARVPRSGGQPIIYALILDTLPQRPPPLIRTTQPRILGTLL